MTMTNRDLTRRAAIGALGLTAASAGLAPTGAAAAEPAAPAPISPSAAVPSSAAPTGRPTAPGPSEAGLSGSGEATDAADLEAIRRVVDGIDDAVDAKDWRRCRAYFTDLIDVDFTALDGGEPSRMSADALVDSWRRNLYPEKASFHSRTNHAVRIRGDRADVRSKGYAFNRLSRPLGDDLWEVWAEYAHRLVREPDGWRCSAIALTSVTHARGNELVRTFVP